MTQPPPWPPQNHPAPGPYPPPAGWPGGPPPQPKRRRWPWVVGGCLGVPLVVFVGLVVIGLALGPSTPADNPEPSAALGQAEAITTREWQLIAKDPDGHRGERIIVYGKVTQFDANTGRDSFRADVDGPRHQPDSIGYVSYPTNTVLTGNETALRQIVEGDIFRAEATVTGASTYGTTLGGQQTVPALTVTAIDVIGHTS